MIPRQHVAQDARGITLIELLIAISVLAALLALAAPSFAALLRQWRFTSTVDTLTGDLRLARSTAIRTSRPASLCVRDGSGCGTGGEWRGGWLVFSDFNGDGILDAGEPVIAQRGPQPGIASITSATPVTFRSNGTLNAATAGLDVKPSGADPTNPGLGINLTATGRVGTRSLDDKAPSKDKQ